MKSIDSEAEFNKVIHQPETVIIKFETDWCPDCKRLNTYVNHLEKAVHFQWFSADRDRLPELGQRYDVLGIPSLLAFKNGKKTAHLRADDKTPEEILSFLASIKN